MPEHKFTVEDLKTRLDKFLAEQFKGVSRSQIQRDIGAGLVLVNGVKVLESKHVVRKSDVVAYHQNETKVEGLIPTNTPLRVLYDNHGLLIIDKPAGLTVHPGAGYKGETLASALLYHFKDIYVVGEEHRPGIVHRLDKDTSGVMLVAKSAEMYEYLKDAFAERKIKKEYVALVLGRIEKLHGLIDTPIGKSKADFRKYSAKNMVESKEALTEYTVLEYLRNPSSLDEYTLIRVKLHTGRTHQIRVHFSSFGHPLLGDSLYGGGKTELAGLKRQFLHAKKIEVQLPDRTWIEAESDLADDLKEVLRSLNSKLINQL
jgi:23S rRNA pseudouridine1911/1915/1917 synthase